MTGGLIEHNCKVRGGVFIVAKEKSWFPVDFSTELTGFCTFLCAIFLDFCIFLFEKRQISRLSIELSLEGHSNC